MRNKKIPSLEYLSKCPDICPTCREYKSCVRPCHPINKYLSYLNRKPHEKNVSTDVTVLYHEHLIYQEGSLVAEDKMGNERAVSRGEMAFSTETDSPFSSSAFKHKTVGIIVDRIFHKFSYADLAFKYDLTNAARARSLYHHAERRLRDVVAMMDQKDQRKKGYWIEQAQKRSGNMPDDIKIFLLHNLFKLSAPEIGKIYNRQDTSVARTIKRVADRMMAGEINLLTLTSEESSEAKNHIENVKNPKNLLEK